MKVTSPVFFLNSFRMFVKCELMILNPRIIESTRLGSVASASCSENIFVAGVFMKVFS